MRSSVFLFFCGLGLVAACSSSEETPNDGAKEQGSATPAIEAPAKPDGESKESEEKPKDPTTSVFVGIDSEPLANSGFNLTSLIVEVKVDGLVAASTTYLAASGPLFPREVRVDAPAAKPDAEIEVHVSGMMGDGLSPVVERRARTRFVADHKKLLHMYLQTRCVTLALLGGFFEPAPECPVTETCNAGKCVSPDVDPGTLPDYRADWTTSPPSACGAGTAATIDANISEGATVTLERGGQCGHHFYVDLSAMKDLSQFKTITSLSAVMPNSAITIPTTSVPYSWASTPSGACELSHVRFQVDTPGHKVEEYLGQAMDVTITAKDDQGHTASILRHVKVADTFLNPTGRPCN